MRSEAYWIRAALLREIAVQAGATHTANEVLRLYDGALDDIDGEIRKIKYNFGKRYGIDAVTAEYHLNRTARDENLNTLIGLLEAAPDAEARAKILEYIRRDGLSVRAYSARIERYEQLKSVIYAKVMSVAKESTEKVGDMLKTAYREGYYGMMDDTARGLNVGINFAVLNDRAIDEAVNAKWNGKRFSQRIWGNTDRLAREAQELVARAVISGESYAKTSGKLADAFEVEKFRATTLIRTETAHIHAEADKKAYEDLGIDEYKYLATLDDRTCETCQALDGRVFKVSAAREGVNYPTMHPRCRCTTTINKAYLNRRARNPLNGKSELVDGNLDYKAWKEDLTPEQKEALDSAMRKDTRTSADKLKAAVDKSGKDGIIDMRGGRIMNINNIDSPIEKRNTGKGNPNAVIHAGRPLNNRQSRLLGLLPEFDSSVTVRKKDVNMRDLAALTAQTGDEFAVFTKGGERLIIRGNYNSVNVDIERAKALSEQGYKWSGHTHPGIEDDFATPSQGDRDILTCFNQKMSVIYNSKGKFRTFEKE